MVGLALTGGTHNAAPTGLLADYTPARERTQAMSLMRVVGDFGFFCGAVGCGLISQHFGTETAFLALGAALSVNATAFAARIVTGPRGQLDAAARAAAAAAAAGKQKKPAKIEGGGPSPVANGSAGSSGKPAASE